MINYFLIILVCLLKFNLSFAKNIDIREDIKIGFVTTLTTPAALIGKQQQKGADLAMDHLGNKMAGKSVKIFYEDDGLKPKTGKQKTEKLLKKDKVDLMAG